MTRLALGIDFSSQALHLAHGPGPFPHLNQIKVEGDMAEERIDSTVDGLSEVLVELEARWGPIELSLMVIEKPFMGFGKARNVVSTVTLAQIQAACLATCHLFKWIGVQRDPSVIRKEIIGQGSSSKKGEIKHIVVSWVKREYGLALTEDQADAVVIWKYALSLLERIEREAQVA